MESTKPSTPVHPISPPAPYLGGKRNLAGRICRIIDGIEHSTYVEPFVGMGGIFFRRRAQPKCEVINDYGRDVANLFRILQRHYPQFLDVMKFQLTTRAEFDRLTKVDADTLTDLERAARFLYLQRTAFGGKPSGRHFGVAKDRPARFNLTTLEPMLEDIHARLSGVVIECLSYADVIRRYDGAGTLFYLDPPYWGNERDYGPNLFGRGDFQRIANLLETISGEFILSINDHPGVRDVFGAFELHQVETSYTVSVGKARRAPELLITSAGLLNGLSTTL